MSRTDHESPKRRSKRRWLQFRLRTMLLAVTAVALWLGLHFYPAQRQRRAVEAIEASGGTVGYDDQVIGEVKVLRQKNGTVTVQGLRLSGRRKSRVPQWVRNRLGDDLFSTVTWVGMTGPEIGDKQLAHLAELPRLRYLDLSWTGVTDDGLKHLAGLTQLEELNLSGTPVRDKGLAHLRNLSNLRRLNLQTTLATTAGMKHLAQLGRLRAVELGTTGTNEDGRLDADPVLRQLRAIVAMQSLAFTDPSSFNGPLPEHGGLLHLKKLKDLEFLDVTFTHATAGEVKELQTALPNLVIRHRGDLIAQTQALRKRWLEQRQAEQQKEMDRLRELDRRSDLQRHDEGMLFDAWQRRRQGFDAPGAR